MKNKGQISVSGKITITLLLILAGTNALWLVMRGHGGALIALVFYFIVFYRCLRNRHFHAGVIAGILGVGFHVYELFLRGMTDLMGIDRVFFYTNLILPIPLIFASYFATRKEPREHGV